MISVYLLYPRSSRDINSDVHTLFREKHMLRCDGVSLVSWHSIFIVLVSEKTKSHFLLRNGILLFRFM